MDIRLDNWTEEDFKLPSSDDHVAADPWRVSSDSAGADSAEARPQDDALSSRSEIIPSTSLKMITDPQVVDIQECDDRERPDVVMVSENNGYRIHDECKFSTPAIGQTPPPDERTASQTSTPYVEDHRKSVPSAPSVHDPNINELDQLDSADSQNGFRRVAPEDEDLGFADEFGEPDIDLFDDFTAFDIISDNYEDEPEPIAEFESDLQERLFEQDLDRKVSYRAIKINQWFTSLGHIDDDVRVETTQTLMGFTDPKFNFWFAWMQTKAWDEDSLLRFFRFRAYWDDNSEFWERILWSPHSKKWHRSHSPYSLSLDKTYILVHRNLQFSADYVIDEEWLADWDYLDTRILIKQGFFSFSDFVMYRSQLHFSEDWRRRPDLGVDFDSKVDHYLMEKSINQSASYLTWTGNRNPIENWFEIQDWYPRVEWDDG